MSKNSNAMREWEKHAEASDDEWWSHFYQSLVCRTNCRAALFFVYFFWLLNHGCIPELSTRKVSIKNSKLTDESKKYSHQSISVGVICSGQLFMAMSEWRHGDSYSQVPGSGSSFDLFTAINHNTQTVFHVKLVKPFVVKN